jgi:hypothetical protein
MRYTVASKASGEAVTFNSDFTLSRMAEIIENWNSRVKGSDRKIVNSVSCPPYEVVTTDLYYNSEEEIIEYLNDNLFVTIFFADVKLGQFDKYIRVVEHTQGELERMVQALSQCGRVVLPYDIMTGPDTRHVVGYARFIDFDDVIDMYSTLYNTVIQEYLLQAPTIVSVDPVKLDERKLSSIDYTKVETTISKVIDDYDRRVEALLEQVEKLYAEANRTKEVIETLQQLQNELYKIGKDYEARNK